MVEICNMEHIQVTDLTEGDYSDSFNYLVKGKGSIGILTEEMGCLTEQRTFQLSIKVEGDNVVAVKDNRIDMY